MYHDIVEDTKKDASGFTGNSANSYKINPEQFQRHLKLLKQITKTDPLKNFNNKEKHNWSISFDDGGIGGYEYAAPILEEFNWRGCFFISTYFVDRKGFMSSGMIQELYDRGHTIASHTCSHRNLRCVSNEEKFKEWKYSLNFLENIIGEKPNIASIPFGDYDESVIEQAQKAGIKFIFTSEPVTKVWNQFSCKIYGRFSIDNDSGDNYLRSIFKDFSLYRFQDYIKWNVKKGIKKNFPEMYRPIRNYYF
jgi:peptidoglycan/xylan/chitin deacetylase (PgdA/CDA1 family)